MSQHKAVSTIVLILIGVLTLASIGNIHAKIITYHEGWTALLIAAAFGIGLAVLVYVVMIAQTNRTRWTAALLSLLFGAASATLQVALYMDESAAMPVAFALGVTVPLMEAALAIVEALLRHEIESKAESGEIESLQLALQSAQSDLETERASLRNLTARNAQLNERIDRLQAQPAQLAPQLPAQSATPESVDASGITEAQVEIIRVIAENPQLQQKEIADATGKSATAISRQLKPLKDGGLVEFDGAMWNIHPQVVAQLNGKIAK